VETKRVLKTQIFVIRLAEL